MLQYYYILWSNTTKLKKKHKIVRFAQIALYFFSQGAELSQGAEHLTEPLRPDAKALCIPDAEKPVFRIRLFLLQMVCNLLMQKYGVLKQRIWYNKFVDF